MAPSMSTSRRGRFLPVALAAAALWCASETQAFASVSGLNRKQELTSVVTRFAGSPRIRSQLPKNVLEIRDEEEPVEAPPKPDMPDDRVPYAINMMIGLPNQKEEMWDTFLKGGSARGYLEKKLTGALDQMEDMIRTVDLQLKVEEHFHKDKEGHKKVVMPETTAVEKSDGSIVEEPNMSSGSTGAKVLAPYQIKVMVSLKNGKEIMYSNPEKHAEGTLTEAADSMADGLRKLLREEKDKMIAKNRQAKGTAGLDDTFEDEPIDEIGAAEDAVVEDLYQRIEAQKE